MAHDTSTGAREAQGAHARFVTRCANRPWTVIGIFLACFFALLASVIALPPTFKNEFTLPGSDTQRATDLLESKFPGQEGDSLRVVIAAPAGEQLDTPARRRAIEAITTESKKIESPTEQPRRSHRTAGRSPRVDESVSPTSSSLRPRSNSTVSRSSTSRMRPGQRVPRPAFRWSSPARQKARRPNRAPQSSWASPSRLSS